MYKIYKITNLVNQKVYIGQTKTTLEDRWHAHRYFKRGTMYNHIKEHGAENFEICILDTADTREEAVLKEVHWTKHYNSTNPEYGYNIKIGDSYYGRVVSEDTRKKLSIMFKGREGLRGEANPHYGKHLSPNHRIKISNTLKGRYAGDKNPFYGKKHTPETLEKLSGENHWTTRKSFSEETKKKMSAAQSGVKSNTARPCMCVETGEIFEYMKLAAIKYNLQPSKITACCRGKRKTTGGFHWRYV